jgi:hypothetical protein
MTWGQSTLDIERAIIDSGLLQIGLRSGLVLPAHWLA